METCTVFANFTPLIFLQVARKIAPCDRTLTNVQNLRKLSVSEKRSTSSDTSSTKII